MQEGLKELEVLLDPYDWFYEVRAEARRYVVYVTYMDKSQDTVIPDMVQGRQVVVHFSSAITASASDFMGAEPKKFDPFAREPFIQLTKSDMEVLNRTNPTLDEMTLIDDVGIPNIGTLTRELDRLEKQCGSNILQDIFYEIHDGRNAVTNLGARYPEVQADMKRLYDDYGFDTIYNELDG